MSHHNELDPDFINEGTKPEMRWEMRDTEQYLGPIIKVSFWFFATSIIFIIISIPIMNLAAGKGISMSMNPYVDLAPPKVPSAPNPLLQSGAKAMADIYELRKEQDLAIHSYGWVDEKKGIAHIPVDEAVKKVVASGLPGGAAQP